MSGEMRVDREALALALYAAAHGVGVEDVSKHEAGFARVLALLPAPHPQGGTEALRARIEALCDEADAPGHSNPAMWGYLHTASVRALLAAAPAPRGFCSCIDRPAADCGIPEHRVAAAPAPTEGDPYCICGGGADHDDDCPRADEAGPGPTEEPFGCRGCPFCDQEREQ